MIVSRIQFSDGEVVSVDVARRIAGHSHYLITIDDGLKGDDIPRRSVRSS